jgi:pimeloyl-ACP methyl ester carboxylesterase
MAATAVIGVLAASPAQARDSASDPTNRVTCNPYTVPVQLASSPSGLNIAGELCATPFDNRADQTVQVLVHGAATNHAYWDFGTVDGMRYSYARDVAKRGIATFAIDELGTGESSHPLSTDLHITAVADATHQVVQALRSGSATGTRFGKVILVGHSLGSVVAWEEAINFADVDGVVVTGAAHSLTQAFAAAGQKNFIPATSDPKFAASGLDGGYLTTLAGTRAGMFFNVADSDPAVIASDEARKDVLPGPELGTALPIVTTKDTLAIKVPVLDILGGQDFTTCGPSTTGGNFSCSSGAAVAQQEQPFYSPEAKLHACVVPGSGHDLSLALNHEVQVRDSVAWSLAFVGQRGFAEDNGRDASRLPENCS